MAEEPAATLEPDAPVPEPDQVEAARVTQAPDWESQLDAMALRVRELEASIPAGEQKALQKGREAGFAEGVKHGEAAAAELARRNAQAEYEQALSAAADSVRQILESRNQMRRQMEEDLVHLAVAVARRILHREISADPEALTGIVKAVVAKIETRELHRILVAPYDATFVRKHFDTLGLPARVEIAADGSLVRGSVVLETARGQIDASVETQLQEIDRGFADLVRRS